MLGSSFVGKTSLILRYVHDAFSPSLQSTIGSAYVTKSIPINDNESLVLDIWDTAGQERFRSMNMHLYYRGSTAAVIVYDVTSKESFQQVAGWVRELREAVGTYTPSTAVPEEEEETEGKPRGDKWYLKNGLVIALVGNKVDLTLGTKPQGIRGEDLGSTTTNPVRQVPTKFGADYARREGMLFFETSAKNDGDEGVKQLFEEVVFWCNVKNEREGVRKGGRPSVEGKVTLEMPGGNGGCCG